MPRAVESWLIAASNAPSEACALVAVDKLIDAMCRPPTEPRVDVTKRVMLNDNRSFAVLLMPTWKLKPVEAEPSSKF